jgi:multidrug efflux pump subunit AcrA (membrane-fusion protein)
MTANVTIITNQVENALLVPSTAVFADDTGQQVVYLVTNGNTTTVPVKVGATSDTFSQITDGTLQEGDTIVLSFASTTSTTRGGFGFGGGGGAIRAGDAPPAGNP